MPLAAEGEFALARQHLEATTAVPVAWFGEHHFHALLADVAARQRDAAALGRYAPLIERTARQCGHRLYEGVAQRAWGVLHRLNGELDLAEERLQSALALFQGLGTRWQLGRTYGELAEVARARRDGEAARGHYEQALALFEAIQAAPDAERTRRALADVEAANTN